MLIETTEDLRKIIDKAMQTEAVALDTEFVWERTFYPDLGLIQLGIERECYLIDPLKVNDMSSLGELLSSPNVTKILHDALQDLTILKRAANAVPVNIFDTRAAYGFCSDSSILSLAALIEKTMGIELAKSETRTNWLQRPLTPDQIDYACDDVKYMCEIRRLTIEKCRENGTLLWLEEDMSRYDAPEIYLEIDPMDYFRKIKGANRLKAHQLAVLKHLAAWREETAREKNRPRGHILHNNTLLDLSWKTPSEIFELKKISKMHPRAIDKYGETILKIIQGALAQPEEKYPEVLDTRFNRKLSERTDAALEKMNEKAVALNIDPALLCNKKELRAFLESNCTDVASPLGKGWRKEFIADLDL